MDLLFVHFVIRSLVVRLIDCFPLVVDWERHPVGPGWLEILQEGSTVLARIARGIAITSDG